MGLLHKRYVLQNDLPMILHDILKKVSEKWFYTYPKVQMIQKMNTVKHYGQKMKRAKKS